MHFLLEALFVGICTMIFGYIISYIMMGKAARDFEHWNRVLLSYFLTGVVAHVVFEITGLNKKYCDSKK